MRCEKLLLAALLAALALPVSPAADACGPDFPIELLADRPRAMAELPEGIFLDEVAELVRAPGPYGVSARPPPGPGPSDVELALYQRGADAFHADRFADARRAFTRLLALPPAQRHHRSTWAAYMLGRLDDDAGSGAASSDQRRAAIAAYRQVRTLVDDGYVDELGLAASSLGQEARLHADESTALYLYAQQAALGDTDGGLSLLLRIRALVDRGGEVHIVGDALGQRLLAIYLYTRGDELSDEQRARVWAVLMAVPHPAGADQLAAVAYRAGNWDAAERLATDDTRTSRWVRAKLALRAGDHAAADRLLRGVVDSYDGSTAEPPYDDMSAYTSLPRAQAERAVLALADGRVTDAMAAAWEARRLYRDAFYIGERVLTIDELRRFVDTLPPPEPDEEYGSWGVPGTAAMRAMLGRRLMRDERFVEALRYLPPEHHAAALHFARLTHAARATDDRFAQASALYQAAAIARTDGLELLGTEHAPDWASWGGAYDLGDDAVTDGWLGPDERARTTASAPAFAQRYHYRFVASKLAEDAADRLPQPSQAFAATLCWSAHHVFNRDADRVQALYRRYVADGPSAVDMNFGQACPEPEVDRARRFAATPRVRPRWHLALPLAAVAVLVAALTVIGLTRRRHRRFAARP